MTSLDMEWSPQEIEVIKSQIAPGISDPELQLFSIICKQTGLNPFNRQIYAIMRNKKVGDKWVKSMTIQTGIDGYRFIAMRSEKLAGIDDAEFDSEDKTYPNRAKVTVWRMVQGHRCPFTATARWLEYVQSDKDISPTGMWKKMPYLMLAKCAEALALRKAFPAELAGIYTDAEMSQADDTQYPVSQPTINEIPPQKPTETVKPYPTKIIDPVRQKIADFCTTRNYPLALIGNLKNIIESTDDATLLSYLQQPIATNVLNLLKVTSELHLSPADIVKVFKTDNGLPGIETAASMYDNDPNGWRKAILEAADEDLPF